MLQEHDGVNWPVMFTSRALKPNEINYGAVEKEFLALLRMLDIYYTLLVSQDIKVLTRYYTLAWLMQSSGLNKRLGRWAVLLSVWTLRLVGVTKRRTKSPAPSQRVPQEDVDEMLIAIAPRKQPRQNISMPPPKVMHGEVLLVVSFDGSARINKKGLYSAVIWKLPEWTILSAASHFDTGLTVNEAEYNGLLLSCELLARQTREIVVISGDSNLVITQLRGEIDYKAPGLQLSSFCWHDFVNFDYFAISQT